MSYSFLTGIKLVDTNRQRAPKTNTPTGLTVRVMANGNVYPSPELVTRFNLEYTTKDATDVRNGFDVVDSLEWAPTATLPRMILFGVTRKKESKVDLFGTCRFNEDGTPKSSVLTQGLPSETLLNLVRSMGYLTDDQKYVDLELVVEHPLTTEDGISNIPKVMERGEKKGEKTYERRENATYYPVNTTENLKTMREATTTTGSIPVNQTVTNN